jgi:hypothetical protein
MAKNHMKLTDHAAKIITYLNAQPGKTDTLQNIVNAMAHKGMGQGIVSFALQYLKDHAQITHNLTYPKPNTPLHHYTAV